MKNGTKMRLKIREFFHKYKNIIIVCLVIWAVIFAVNMLLKYRKIPEIPKTTYTPNKSIMDNDKVPDKVQTKVSTILDEFVGYCNKKEYEKAYHMIDEECRNQIYTSIDLFKLHIDQVFGKNEKIYNIQNFSNQNNVYIYNVRILEDIIKTGTTGGEFTYYEEKMVFKDTKDGVKLCLGGFIDKEDINLVVEDEYLKIAIESKVTNYETEIYYTRITNKSQDTIVLMDNTITQEIELFIGNQYRNLEGYDSGAIVIYPGRTKVIPLEFTKFFDDGRTSSELIFNSIRVLKEYSGEEDKREQELANATKLYSLKIDLKGE